jgi:hypothetical protein
MDIEQVMAHHHDQLLAIPGVTGVGIGLKNGQPAIVIMVNRLTLELKARLPQQLDGIPVVVEQSGVITPF